MRARRKAVLTSAAVVALLVVLAALRADGDDELRLETAQVTPGTIARRVMATGTIKPERAVEVGAQVSGTIASIHADFNSPVRAGQVLARLDTSAYEARIAEAEAAVAKAQAERTRLLAVLDDARVKLARAETLAADALVPQAELDLARTTEQLAAANVRRAEAEIAAAQAAVTEARVSLRHTTIRSPIDGLVISRHVDAGQTIAAAVRTPVLFTIADVRRMQLLAEVAEGDVAGIGPGSVVAFEVESIGDRTFEGTVSAVRLQPVVEESAASASGTASSIPLAAGPPGTPGMASATAGAAPPSGANSAASPPSAAPPSRATVSAVPGSTPAVQGSQPGSGAPASPQSGTAPATGVVTYAAVIDVDNAGGAIPPGATAILTLDGATRDNVLRIPNRALAFHPSARAFAALDQEPPILKRPDRPSASTRQSPARQVYVWKFEHRRFVPVLVETGLADDHWTELARGDLAAGDVLVTAAEPPRR
jgi:HlyD family secretion protein